MRLFELSDICVIVDLAVEIVTGAAHVQEKGDRGDRGHGRETGDLVTGQGHGDVGQEPVLSPGLRGLY